MEKYHSILQTMLESGTDEGIVVDQELLSSTQQRFTTVQHQAQVRSMSLTFESLHSRLMTMFRNGQEQIEREPVKFSSKEQAERTYKEHTVRK